MIHSSECKICSTQRSVWLRNCCSSASNWSDNLSIVSERMVASATWYFMNFCKIGWLSEVRFRFRLTIHAPNEHYIIILKVKRTSTSHTALAALAHSIHPPHPPVHPYPLPVPFHHANNNLSRLHLLDQHLQTLPYPNHRPVLGRSPTQNPFGTVLCARHNKHGCN